MLIAHVGVLTGCRCDINPVHVVPTQLRSASIIFYALQLCVCYVVHKLRDIVYSLTSLSRRVVRTQVQLVELNRLGNDIY